MLLINETNKIIQLLQANLDVELKNCVRKTANRCSILGVTPQEPDFIASMVIDFAPSLFRVLNTLLPTISFTVSSVFCHQKPLADYGSHPIPEIGDLLFVLVHTDGSGAKFYNSLLFQAKISSSTDFVIAPTDHQLKLYSNWPKFRYKRAGALTGTVRDIQPKTATVGAQYLLIDDHPILSLAGLHGTFPFGCAFANSAITLDSPLYYELVNFLKFKTGRAFENRHPGLQDDWSQMIWDLIDIAKNKASKRKHSGLKSFPRLKTSEADGLAFLTTNPTSIFYENKKKSGNIKEETVINDDNDGGVSLILIESSIKE